MVKTQENLLKIGTDVKLVVDETSREHFQMDFDSYG